MAAPSDKNDSKELPPDRLWQPTTAKWLAAVLGVALAYAIVRYHIASGVSWSHFPLFIMNKAVSLAATVLVACSSLAAAGPTLENTIRTEADVPLVVPEVVDAMIAYYQANRDALDYLSNRQYTDEKGLKHFVSEVVAYTFETIEIEKKAELAQAA